MRIIGIDPGLSGGIAVLDDLKIFDLFDMPIMPEGKKNKNQLNSAMLVNIIKNHIVIGQTFGSIKGICAALNLPIFYVRPNKWKKHFELINSSKDASRTKVIEMYPSITTRLSKKKDVNKADAVLIARYFRDCRAKFNE